MAEPLLRNLLVGAIPLFFLHGFEEGLTGIFELDSFFRYFGSRAAYVLAAELAIIAAVLYLAAIEWGSRKTNSIFLVSSGILFLFEAQHIYAALLKGGYYPGLITAVMIVLMGLYYWGHLFSSCSPKKLSEQS